MRYQDAFLGSRTEFGEFIRAAIPDLFAGKLRVEGQIVELYSEVNPLSSAEKNTVYIDLLFPHWFYGLVKNQFQGGKTLKASEIERIARLEEAKVPILNAIMK